MNLKPNLKSHSRPFAVGLLLAAGALAALPAVAQKPPTEVMIRAYDSKGVDTGKCLEGTEVYSGTTVSFPTAGWRLATCSKTAPGQRFAFDTNTQGAPLSHIVAAKGGDGVAYCPAVLTGKTTPAVWKVNTIVAASACTTKDAGTLWKWSGGQIIATESPASARMCLTANSAMGTGMRLGDCSKPPTLTRWDMQVLPALAR